jgi:methylmalonyl-CoA/ethylmalonyl-CoA epimerase
MIAGIDHVGIATRSIERTLKHYRDVLDLDDGELEQLEIEDVAEQKVRVAVVMTGQGRVELLEPTSEESTIAGFIEKRGEGMHHLAFTVRDIDAEMARLKSLGVRMIDERPRVGAGGIRIAFVHPTSAGGVLTELCERAV